MNGSVMSDEPSINTRTMLRPETRRALEAHARRLRIPGTDPVGVLLSRLADEAVARSTQPAPEFFRANDPREPRAPRVMLSEAAREHVRILHAEGGTDQCKLAAQFGVHRSTIQNILREGDE